MAETAIGVDVGGTRMRVARVSREGDILERVVEPVEQSRDGFVAQLSRLLEQVADGAAGCVGIGVPGRVQGDSGEILSAGYLDVAGLDLIALSQRVLDLPACVENDATMALVAETRMRRDDQGALVMMVTIGTGIGGAIVHNGAPWYGGGVSGQFGHIVVADEGPVCNCGRVGCIETFSSGTALRKMMEEAGMGADIDADTLLRRARDGDPQALGVVQNWTMPMHRALDSLVAMADPACIILGGGLGADMHAALALTRQSNAWFNTPVRPAVLGDQAGVIGAGLRAMDVCVAREKGVD